MHTSRAGDALPPARTVSWPTLPDAVRAGVEALLGDAVARWESQQGGFSPGSADRVLLAGGGRAFVKAVSAAVNPDSPGLHRREARILADLPAGLPVPRFVGCWDDGPWVAVVTEDVGGRGLGEPWTPSDLDAAVSVLDALAASPAPSSLGWLDGTAGTFADDLAGWSRLAAAPDRALDPWAARHLTALVAAAAEATPALDGNALVHGDVRGDNLRLADDGRVVLVDWPWATRGAAWFDAVLLLLNGLVAGGHDPEARLPASSALSSADPAALTGVLAGLAGFFLDAARRPPPVGLLTLRAFQAAQGAAALTWLRRRTGWR